MSGDRNTDPSAAQWQRLRELFDALVDLPPAARAAAVAEHCADDALLRRTLERLLIADAAADAVLRPWEPTSTAAAGPVPSDPLGLAGTAVGHYVVEEWLGSGGMGVVYRGTDAQLQRTVALKFLPQAFSREAGARDRLLREARAASALDHPNICTIHEIGETPAGALYIAMSHYDGETLRERITRGPLDVDEALELCAQAARGLGHAHAHDVVHRDIKPDNLLLTSAGVLKILDFGLARTAISPVTEPQLRAGTACYMSPEQAAGASGDARTDVWSLGIVLYELLTGRRPFAATDPLAALLAITTTDAPPASAARPDLPRAVDELLGRMLARRPADRLADGRAVEGELNALRQLLHAGGAKLRRHRTRPTRSVGVAVAVVALLSIAAASMAWSRRPLSERGAFAPRERVLIADFASSTGDTLLARAVTEALRVDLERSPFVRVVDRGYVSEVLGRMRVDINSPVRGAVAREVALRDGVKAVIDGDIASAGRGFVVSARVLAPGEDRVLLSLRETARDSAGIITAVDRLSRTLRGRLGEPLRTVRAGAPLERITTSSLEALLLYAQGSHAWHVRGDPTKARDLLLEATRLDTAFAMAYRKLGIVAFTDHETRVGSLERAYAFRDRLPMTERLFITGTYHTQLDFDPAEAFRAYRGLVEVDPDNWMALNNLALLHADAGELERAAALLENVSPEYATRFSNQYGVLMRLGRAHEADSVIALGTELFPEHMLVAGRRAMHLVVAGRMQLVDSLLHVWGARPLEPGQHSLLLYGVGLLEAMRGRAAAADGMLVASRPLALRVGSEETWALATTARARAATLVRDDGTTALRYLDAALRERPLESLQRFDRPYIQLATAYAEAGRPAEAARLLDAYEREIPRNLRGSPEPRLVAGAQLALARGRPDAALDTLRLLDALPSRSCRPCGDYTRAVAWDRLAAADSAVAAYTQFVDYPDRAFVPDNLALPRALLRLGELFEARADTARALHYYDRFLTLWAGADDELQPQVRTVLRRVAALAPSRD